MLEFKETFGIVIPDVEEQLKPFSESAFSESHGLVIDVAAIHEGVTNNFNYYSAEELEASLESWTQPYAKPILLNHDIHSEPLGRVMGARMDRESDGTMFTRLQVAITDPIAVEKVTSKRYLTGSIGGMSKQAVCSVCEVDWASSTEMVPCEHKRGKPYKGKLAWLDRRGISNKEWSFVNMPSDERSAVLNASSPVAEADEGWVRPVSFFILNMNEQEVIECDKQTDVLTRMDKKDILPFYQGLKGSFLLASAAAGLEESDNSKENNTMAESKEDTTVTEDDDILKVSDELSQSLAEADQEDNTGDEATDADKDAAAEEDGAKPDEDKKEEAAVDQNSDESENKDETASENADEGNEEDSDEKKDEPEEAAEEQKPEGQEKAHTKDVDPENSDGAPKSRESEDEENGEAAEKDEQKLDDTKDDSVVESELADLKTQVATLTEENTKLRAALHNALVERVVDAKIVVGIVEKDARQEAIEEHASRTASSLRDTLLDIATLPPVQSTTNVGEAVQIDEKIVVDGEDSVVTIGEEARDTQKPDEVLEGILTDVLMGRRVL